MSKQITPAELAELVAGLLINPSLLGELDSTERHQEFMRDIGQVVADHCGGHINQVSTPDLHEKYLSDDFNSPFLSVRPNDSLPSLNRNVWAVYDPAGWDDESFDGLEVGERLDDKSILLIRTSIHQKFALSLQDDMRVPVAQGLDDSNDAYLNAVDALSFSMYGKAAVDLVENTDAAIQSLQNSFANDVVLSDALQAVRMLQAKEVWAALGDVPVDEENQIKVPFLGFPAGIKRLDICQYIEQEFDCSVSNDLMSLDVERV